MLWEGPGAIEECSDEELKARGKQTSTTKPKQLSPLPMSESEGDPSSEDEYIADEYKSRSRIGKVCIHMLLSCVG